MSNQRLSILSRVFRMFCMSVGILIVLNLTGCASFYVDTALKDVKPEQIKKAANPQPVQLLFEFQTKNATNARATELLKKRVADLAQNSGLFSQVSDAPVANGAILNIVINNVPLTDNAFGKGFATGLTFGLAGNTVTDGYVCNVDYIAGNGQPKISKSVRHAIHTVMGAQGAPAGAEKSEGIEDAVNKMLRQIVNYGLNEVATDPSFKS